MAKENTGTNGNTGINENELSVEKKELIKLAIVAKYNELFRKPLGKTDVENIKHSQVAQTIKALGGTDDDTLKILIANSQNSNTAIKNFSNEALRIVSKFVQTDGVDLGVKGDQNRLVGQIDNWWKNNFPYEAKKFSLNTKVSIAIEMLIHKGKPIPTLKLDGTITNLPISKLNRETVETLLKLVA